MKKRKSHVSIKKLITYKKLKILLKPLNITKVYENFSLRIFKLKLKFTA